jgi:deoxyribodipyrimidine photo-lyase
VRTTVVVFTRDLRVTDHPALARAVDDAEATVPLFVLDDTILASPFAAPNRTGFLLESLADLRDSLRSLGGDLIVRRGPWIDEVMRVVASVGADTVLASADVSAFAHSRQRALTRACSDARIACELLPGVTIVPPGAVVPGGSDHYQVFTPYWRRWVEVPRRPSVAAPARVTLPEGIDAGDLPALADLVAGAPAPGTMPGGARAGRARLDAWTADVEHYDARHDDLSGDATSRLSPYLHFGCVSPLEVAHAVFGKQGADPFLRQLCWRDFFHQILAARPEAAWADYRTRGDRWNDDAGALAAWQEGRTGYPVVDAGMRQLAHEGFMHNRARMIVASFLTKDLYVDWRAGARHFLAHLLDGDIANNNLNWQWVAGTGADTNPNRVFNPTVQGTRFDPDGDYVRRWVPELAALRGAATHNPDAAVRRAYDYPDPIVDHHDAIAAYRARR